MRGKVVKALVLLSPKLISLLSPLTCSVPKRTTLAKLRKFRIKSDMQSVLSLIFQNRKQLFSSV